LKNSCTEIRQLKYGKSINHAGVMMMMMMMRLYYYFYYYWKWFVKTTLKWCMSRDGKM